MIDRVARPDPETDAALEDAARRAREYLAQLDARPVAASAQSVQRLGELERPLQPEPLAAARVLEELDRYVSPATMAMSGGRFFGFVIGGALPAARAAAWLATAWDQNTALARITPGAAAVEAIALRWLLNVLGLPAHCEGAFVTGATLANFTALAAARHAVLARHGWSVEDDGLQGAPPVSLVVSAEAHPTLTKSLRLLGFGARQLIPVPVDSQGRMRADTLPRIPSGPAILCVQAGNINTGAFDPFEPLISWAHERNAWVHVDGAFGLWARAAPMLQPLAAGLEHADSWATDAHKWLNVPYDCGLALVREPGVLPSAMRVTAEYLPAGGSERNPSDYTPELSRRARGVEVYAALRSLGTVGLAAMLERNVRQAQRFAALLAEGGCEILNDVVLNQVLVAFGDRDTTLRVVEAIQTDGTCWCGSTVWQGRTAMRISVCSAATTDADVERSAEAMLRAARRVSAGG